MLAPEYILWVVLPLSLKKLPIHFPVNPLFPPSIDVADLLSALILVAVASQQPTHGVHGIVRSSTHNMAQRSSHPPSRRRQTMNASLSSSVSALLTALSAEKDRNQREAWTASAFFTPSLAGGEKYTKERHEKERLSAILRSLPSLCRSGLVGSALL